MFQDKDNNKEGEIRVSFFVEVASEDTDYDTVDSLRWVSHSSSILHVFLRLCLTTNTLYVVMNVLLPSVVHVKQTCKPYSVSAGMHFADCFLLLFFVDFLATSFTACFSFLLHPIFFASLNFPLHVM